MELKTARRIAHLTQSALATKANVHPSTISLIENDKRAYGAVAYQDIVRLARALNVEPQELFPVDDAPVREGAPGSDRPDPADAARVEDRPAKERRAEQRRNAE